MAKRVLSDEEVKTIISEYEDGSIGIESLAGKYKVGKMKIRTILADNGISIKTKGAQITIGNSNEIEQSKIGRYEPSNEHKTLIAVCKRTGKEYDDVNNLSGALTRHIVDIYGDVPIPTNTYQRKKYELVNGKKWFEDYFDIIEEAKSDVIKCCLCDWTTNDITNSSGSLTKHISNEHNLSILEYTFKFPNEEKFWLNSLSYNNIINDDDSSVKCLQCNERFIGLTETHMQSAHNISLNEYKLKYGDDVKIISNNTSKFISDLTKVYNANKENTFTSKGQLEVVKYIEDVLGFKCSINNRSVLGGLEIDILINEKEIGIEYNGLFYHSESRGKHKTYHLDKTKLAESKGVKLIHIFEDEWLYKQDIVKDRLRTILGVKIDKIFARKCIIREIDSVEKDLFLNNIHIQGTDKSSVRLGAFYNDELVGVMTFSKLRKVLGSKNESDSEYELLRFANKSVIGLVSKFLKHFITNYNPTKVISYADRRWSPIADNCVYKKVGFKYIGETKPNYWYSKNCKTREYRYNYRKDILVSKGYDANKTEFEIMNELGYERIWDCGSFKFELTP
jgi:hypothetical protein